MPKGWIPCLEWLAFVSFGPFSYYKYNFSVSTVLAPTLESMQEKRKLSRSEQKKAELSRKKGVVGADRKEDMQKLLAVANSLSEQRRESVKAVAAAAEREQKRDGMLGFFAAVY